MARAGLARYEQVFSEDAIRATFDAALGDILSRRMGTGIFKRIARAFAYN